MANVKIALPTREQEIWADLEIGVLVHYDIQVFQPNYEFRQQWGYHPPAEFFNPAELDTDQWILSAKNAGAKYAVLVAKHCSGFCLWPTDCHGYSVKNSPWKNGKGDIVGDFFASCRKYGLKPGLYYSSSCNAYRSVDNPGVIQNNFLSDFEREASQKNYNELVLKQLEELWTRYGEIFEIWFDGGCLPTKQGGPDIAGLLRKLQPNAVVYQGPEGVKSVLRWVGNERAIAPDDCFASVDLTTESFDGHDERIYPGNPYGADWCPAESDLPNRYIEAFGNGWFWQKGEEQFIVPSNVLFDTYLKSVGRNTNMLIGMVIDDKGLFPQKDAEVFSEFGAMLKKELGTPIVELTSDDLLSASDKYEYKLKLPAENSAKYLVLKEDIKYGERVVGFTVIAGESEISHKCIGHKRIIALPESVSEITLKITESKAEPIIRSIAVY